MAKKGKKQKQTSPSGIKVVADNRKARFNYHLQEKFEAGIVLTGSEIKSIREGNLNLAESYIRPENGELFLLQAHIRQFSHDTNPNYDPVRKRKLLMHKKEIQRLAGKVEAKGLTLVPVRMYLKKGRAKLEIALAKGKASPDKRDSIKERESKREAERAMKHKQR